MWLHSYLSDDDWKSLDDSAAKAGGATAGVNWVHAWVGKVGRIGNLGKIVGLVMASTQTVPLTAVWMLYLVRQHDEVRVKLEEELRRNGIEDGPRDLTYEKLNDPSGLVYVEAVVRETLRLFPPFPLIQREAQTDDTLGGVTIPAGMIVYVVPWLVHHNEAFFKEADSFRPERFLGEKGIAAHADASSDRLYVPFGRGVRMCAGSKLALADIKVLLVNAVVGGGWTSEWVGSEGDVPELGMAPWGVRVRFK